MTTPFQPVGDRARWRIIYDLLQEAKPGDVFTYADLGATLDLDPVERGQRHLIRTAMSRAAAEYEQVHRRAVEVVRGVGYRISEPVDHIRLAQRQQRRAGNAIDRGHALTTRVDLSGADPETRKALEMLAQGFALQRDFNRRIEERQLRQAEDIEAMGQRVQRSEDELSELHRRLARLERDQPAE